MTNEDFIPGVTERELNGPASELGVYIVVPGLPGRLAGSAAPRGESVIRFLDQPSFAETRAARYTPENILHATEGFHAFEGTDSRRFDISGKFFCQQEIDILINNQILNLVRSLVMPDYNKTGAPPTPIKLFAYGTKNIHALPCLVNSYNMNWPNDVDYVTTEKGGEGKIAMPVVFDLSISMVEQHSITQLRKFNLDDFRGGTMVISGF